MTGRAPPQRTCIACRTTGVKRGLVRVVRGAAGDVSVDLTGKKPGRGAYLCRRPECWEAALKRDRLSAALRVPVRPEDRARLRAFAEALKGSVSV
jgi:predicted RNA-binding protein YlxR (DUF448 family)